MNDCMLLSQPNSMQLAKGKAHGSTWRAADKGSKLQCGPICMLQQSSTARLSKE